MSSDIFDNLIFIIKNKKNEIQKILVRGENVGKHDQRPFIILLSFVFIPWTIAQLFYMRWVFITHIHRRMLYRTIYCPIYFTHDRMCEYFRLFIKVFIAGLNSPNIPLQL